MRASQLYNLTLVLLCTSVVLILLYDGWKAGTSVSTDNSIPSVKALSIEKTFLLTDLNNMQIVQQFPLFNDSRLPIVETKAVEKKEEIKQLPFEFVLTGVVLTDSSRVATIHNPKTKETHFFQTGESLHNHNELWEVQVIERFEVTLYYKEKNRKVTLKIKENKIK